MQRKYDLNNQITIEYIVDNEDGRAEYLEKNLLKIIKKNLLLYAKMKNLI